MVSSDCPSISIKPGATTSPRASIVVPRFAWDKLPIAAIFPSRMPISPEYHGDPVPSIMWPLMITVSKLCCAWDTTDNTQKTTIMDQLLRCLSSTLTSEFDLIRHIQFNAETAAVLRSRHPKTSPSKLHIASASHSYTLKWPG